MRESQLNSLTVPGVGSSTPATVFKAADKPMRVMVDNLGPNLVLLAHDTATLSNQPAYANTYRLVVGRERTFVLAPNQGLYAVAVGADGQVSVAISEALPIT